MDVRSVLGILILLSTTPAFADETADQPTNVATNTAGNSDGSRVNRSPAVLGPATDQPVVYSAMSDDPGDAPMNDPAPESSSKNSF